MLLIACSTWIRAVLDIKDVCRNPITGRRVWVVRNIQGSKFGDPFNWSVLVVRRFYSDKSAILTNFAGKVSQPTRGENRRFMGMLRDMGFKRALANRHGVWREYSLEALG